MIGFWFVYSSAACAACLVRQPVYAAILGCGMPLILCGCVSAAMHELSLSEETIRWGVTIAMALSAPAATLTAWQAVRRDWALLR